MSGLKFSNRGLPDVTRYELDAVTKRLDEARATLAKIAAIVADPGAALVADRVRAALEEMS